MLPSTRVDSQGGACSSSTQHWTSNAPLALELGGELHSYAIAYRTWGQLSHGRDNVVVVCHPLTGSADADEWWAPMFGPGKALDPERDFIICSNVLGGCSGSTGPASTDATGRHYGASFPQLTIRDQVRAQMQLADALGVRSIRYVIGGSMGGLQALEWALLDSRRVRALVVIAASARHSAWCMSWSEAQRLALRADSNFRNGDYPLSEPPVMGLGAARAIAMATYRSPAMLEQRYGREDGTAVFGERARAPEDFAVRAWLRHRAEEFVKRFDANSYLTLIDAMDRHDIGHGRGGTRSALRRIRQPALIIAISSDGLYLPAEQRAMYEDMPEAEFVQVPSPNGHDGFLIDVSSLQPHITRFSERLRSSSRSAATASAEVTP